MNIITGQPKPHAGTNQNESPFISTIAIDTIIDVQKLKHIGHDNNSPKNGNLTITSLDHSS